MQRNTYWFTLFFLTTGAAAQTVEITATRDRFRQLDTAAAMVVGRDELLRFGDQTLADALKRLPGITVGGVQGRGGDIRMRGLGNGYTQVLLNGQPVPPGFSIDSMAPEMIERVEIMRVANAELGAQAIAGTINIVLRKSAQRAQREIKLGAGASNGEISPTLNGQLSGKGAGLAYSMAGVFVGSRTLTNSSVDELGLDRTGAPELRRRTQLRERDVRPSMNLSPRISWTLANGDTLTSQNFLRMMKLDLRTKADEQTSLGQPSRFPDNNNIFVAHAETMRSDLEWTHQADAGGRWEIKLGRYRFQRRSTNNFQAFDTLAGAALLRVVDSSANEDSITLGGKFSRSLAGGHTLLAGWDAAHGWRTETRIEHVTPDETYAAQIDRMALFAQDDWTITPALSVSAGLRHEMLRTSTESKVLDAVRQQTHVLSPLIQALYKLSDTQQLRVGVTRTFKMPTLQNLAQRRYTIDNNNSPVNPDQQGNPRLLPERAWGLDLAWERYFGKNAMLSVSTFARRIDDVTIERVFQSGTTWISTPDNAGRANTWGVELEAKFPLQALVAGAPAFDLRANLARNWSRVAAIQGPDNRLASQVPQSASVGFDHRLSALPATVGASFSFQGGGPLRLSERTRAWSGVQRELGLYVLWRVGAQTQWRMSVANLLGQDNLALAGFADQPGSVRSTTATATAPTLRLMFEHKLGN